MADGAYRVIQWATGNVGTHSLRAIAAHPRLELVGVLVYAPEKVGRDAGELCGGERLGIAATDDVERILALEADCVAYNALGDTRDREQSLIDICRLLESGKNVVSTAVSNHMHPGVLGADVRGRLEAACRTGGVSFHSTGINPGFSFDVLPIALSAIACRIERIHVTELVDMSGYTSASIVGGFIGMGLPAEVEAPLDLEKEIRGSAFHASLQLVADALHAELGEIHVIREKAVTPRPIDLAWGRIAAGTVAARRTRFLAEVGGVPRIVYDLVWRVSDEPAPDWPAGAAHYELAIEGEPSLNCRFDIQATSGRRTSLVTAMHAVNAIPHVCEASPGIKTRLDLPFMGGGFFPEHASPGT
jgi:4-hydroxy-tetrahydrodipicolinate reductase